MRHNDRVRRAAFSPDGARAITASSDMTARVWDGITGVPIGEPLRHGGLVYAASFSLDGSRVVTASQDKTARIWDATTGPPIGQPLRHRIASITQRSAPTASACDRFLRQHREGVGRGDRRANRPTFAARRKVNFAEFSPDGSRVVTASDDDTARVWDVSRARRPASRRSMTGRSTRRCSARTASGW